MKPQYLYRWVNHHGLIRAAKNAKLRQGDLFARLNGGREGIENPYALIEQMRGAGGLHRVTSAWITFDYDLCREILRDNRFGTGMPSLLPIPDRARALLQRWPVPPNPVDPPSMLMIDQPEHTRMRKPVAAAFTPRAVARLRDRVITVTDELLAALPDDGPADLVTRFASQVPIAIISEMLGFPDSDREMFLHWGDDISPLLDLGISWRAHSSAMKASERVHAYLLDHIERLRAEPGDDILSSLVTAGDLSDHELCTSATLLMGAGQRNPRLPRCGPGPDGSHPRPARTHRNLSRPATHRPAHPPPPVHLARLLPPARTHRRAGPHHSLIRFAGPGSGRTVPAVHGPILAGRGATGCPQTSAGHQAPTYMPAPDSTRHRRPRGSISTDRAERRREPAQRLDSDYG